MRMWLYGASRGPQFALYSSQRIEEYCTILVAKVLCSRYVPAGELMWVVSAKKG